MIKQKIDLETKLKVTRLMHWAVIDLLAELIAAVSDITREEIVGIIERRVEELRRRRDPNDLEGQMEVQALRDTAARLRAPPEAVVVNKGRTPLN